MTVYEAVSIVGQYSIIAISVLTLVVTLIINQKKK
ncbi:putative holin-like toxin [Jeotgalibacillus proteolyticus]|nr:putative holin-like toxin [Jeotgalibacillus proteolyticus]